MPEPEEYESEPEARAPPQSESFSMEPEPEEHEPEPEPTMAIVEEAPCEEGVPEPASADETELFRAALARRWGGYVPAPTARELALAAADARRDAGLRMATAAERAACLRACARAAGGEGAVVERLLHPDGAAQLATVLHPPFEAPPEPEPGPGPQPEPELSAAQLRIERLEAAARARRRRIRQLEARVACVERAQPEPEPAVPYWPALRQSARRVGRQWLSGGVTLTDASVTFVPQDSTREHAVVSAAAFSREDGPVAYFEATVVAVGKRFVGIGVVPPTYPRHRQPGWEEGSWGMHSDDGKLYEQQPAEDKAKQTGEKFGQGDVVGCGCIFGSGMTRLFWTKNGKLLKARVELRGKERVLHPAVGLGAEAKVECEFGESGKFAFDTQTMLPREPSSLGQCCLLAKDFAEVRDAAEGPLKVGEPGTVEAIDARGDCLVSGWWFDRRALICPLELQPVPGPPREAKDPEMAVLECGPGVSADGQQLVPAPRHGSSGIVARSAATFVPSEPSRTQLTLRLKSSSAHRRFALGVVEDDTAAENDAQEMYRLGWGVRTAGVAGSPLMPELELPSKDEDARRIEITIVAGAGRLEITKRGTKPKGSEEEAGDVAAEVVLAANIESAGLARLAVCVFPGCELELVGSPAGAAASQDLYELRFADKDRHRILAAKLVMAQAGAAFEESAGQEHDVPCLVDRSEQPPIEIAHAQPILAYIARKHGLYPADLRSATNVDMLLAAVDKSWASIISAVELSGVESYVKSVVVDAVELGTTASGPLASVAALVDGSAAKTWTIADHSVALLTAFHLRLCPAATATYTSLIAHFMHFRQAHSSPAALGLLRSAGLAITEAWIAQQLRGIIETDFAAIREALAGARKQQQAGGAAVRLHDLPLVDPSVLTDPIVTGYRAIVQELFAAVLQSAANSETDGEDRDQSTNTASSAHRLACLYDIQLEELCPPAVLAQSAVREAALQLHLPAARDWWLRAFDLCASLPEQDLARRSLLSARINDLKDCSRSAQPLSRQFSTTKHHRALHYNSRYEGIEAEAWATAFPPASEAVAEILTGVLDDAFRRHELLEGERAHIADLQAGRSLTQTDSGTLHRGNSEEGKQPVVVSDNIASSRPHHVLSPAPRPPRHRLSTLLNGLEVSKVVLAANACGAVDRKKKERKVKRDARNGGAFYYLLKVVPQTNNDACGYHSFYNGCHLARALCSDSLDDSQNWMKDIHSTRNFEREMAEMQKTLRSEAKRRHADPSTSPWEVGSIMERSHAVWLLRTDARVATLGGEHTFSVVEFLEGDLKSFDLEATIEFNDRVLKSFAEASDEAMLKVVLVGTTEGKETGHWVILAAARLPGKAPEFALLDSQNKVSTKSVGKAAELLVRCFLGEASLLQSVLVHRLAPLLTAVQDAAAGEGDSSLAKLRATKPAAAWKQVGPSF